MIPSCFILIILVISTLSEYLRLSSVEDSLVTFASGGLTSDGAFNRVGGLELNRIFMLNY